MVTRLFNLGKHSNRQFSNFVYYCGMVESNTEVQTYLKKVEQLQSVCKMLKIAAENMTENSGTLKSCSNIASWFLIFLFEDYVNS